MIQLRRVLPLPILVWAVIGCAAIAWSEEQLVEDSLPASSISAGVINSVPDIREEESQLKFGSGNLVAVPIPVSNPTFGTGLVAAGAYYYGQTEAQKKAQPPSFTGAGGVYTDNKSYAAGVLHQQYWNEDRWRFTGSAGYADFKLVLADPVPENDGNIDWLVKGFFAQLALSRRISSSDWFVGGLFRYIDIEQEFDAGLDLPDFNLGEAVQSPSLGLNVLYDTRDNATNAYNGLRFDGEALFSETAGGNGSSYQSYSLRMRGYHELEVPVVIAWDVHGCTKSGEIPLWDTCRLGLRGFPATLYLSRQSMSAQVEARWSFHKRWGAVVFAGGGMINDATKAEFEEDIIPSFGVGLRFMVMKSQRINLRVDYARSDDTSAWYLGVTEYF
jgi:outer membrane protein assembly factor BamA